MDIGFYKAHGLGNDFVIIDISDMGVSGRDRLIKPDVFMRIADRHKGIGCDQVIVFARDHKDSVQSTENRGRLTDVWFYNKDGTEAETCGNGLRCLAFLLSQKTGEKRFLITAKIGKRTIRTYESVIKDNYQVMVNMGAPSFIAEQIPLKRGLDPLNIEIEVDGLNLCGSAVNVGNPHIVFFVNDLDAVDFQKIGPAIEVHPYFPDRINVSFAKINTNINNTSNCEIYLRVWERGSGLTQACGSAACAAVAITNKKHMIQGLFKVFQSSGCLELSISETFGDIYQTATAEIVFSGQMTI